MNAVDAALEAVKEETNHLLEGMGEAGEEARRNLASYLQTIQPDVDEAIASGSTMSLEFIRDRIAMKTADCFLDLAAAEREKIVAFVNVALSTAIKIALV